MTYTSFIFNYKVMKEFKIILIVMFIISAVTYISLQHEKANADENVEHTNVKTFTEIELDNSNNYFCTQARSRGASEQYLFSNWCE